MLGKTHFLAGTSLGLASILFFQPSFSSAFLFFVVALFASLLPDIDEPHSLLGRYIPSIGVFFKHRGFFHSTLFLALVAALLFLLLSSTIALIFVVGFIGHLLLDACTKQGVTFFPFGRFRGPCKTNGVVEHVVRLLLFASSLLFAMLIFV